MEANTSQGTGIAPMQQAGNTDAAFRKFDSYPWVSDRSFLQGLMATLGPALVNNSDGFKRQKALSTTLQARIWWYKSRFNVDIDRIAYEAYGVAHPSSGPGAAILDRLEQIQQRMGIAPAGTSSSSVGPSQTAQNIPAWQLSAPRVDLSKKADDAAGHASGSGDGTPFPGDFEALVEAVTTGKPIPGIKEIPDTVERPPGVTPFGKMKAPSKPWEKNLPPDALAQPNVFGDVADKEFPPLPPDNSIGSESQPSTQ